MGDWAHILFYYKKNSQCIPTNEKLRTKHFRKQHMFNLLIQPKCGKQKHKIHKHSAAPKFQHYALEEAALNCTQWPLCTGTTWTAE